MNFEVNAHCLVRKMKFQGRNSEKIIEIDWAPILKSSNTIDKILVSIKDATEHTLLRAKHADAEEILDYIRELIEIEPSRFIMCYQDNQRMINDSINMISPEQTHDKQTLKELFTNMHTIKGNSRNFNLSRVVMQAAIIESRYAQLLQDNDSNLWNLCDMTAELRELERINRKYYEIALKKMGWDNDVDSIKISKKVLLAEIDRLDTKELNELPESFRDPIRNILKLVNKNCNDSFISLVDDVKKTAIKLAKDLHKASPVIVVKGSDFILKQQGHEVLRKSFIHIIRNALDHGIEFVEDRLAHNKSPEGHIYIEAVQHQGYLSIVIQDDGRGLNIARLRNLGEKLGLLSQNESNTTIAQLVFEDGLSTSEKVSDISGRGVGMAAIKRFLKQLNGEVRIHVKADSPNLSYVPIEIELQLPDQYYFIA